MEEVKKKFEEFAKDEALAFDANIIPDLEKQQLAVDKLHRHVVPEMEGELGVVRLHALKSPMFYRMHSDDEGAMEPRNLFKISEYESSAFGSVWVAYCSDKGFAPESSALTHALFIFEKNNELIIGAEYLYSDFHTDGLYYEWVKGSGIESLTFESLGELKEIKRYREPSTKMSKELYLKDS